MLDLGQLPHPQLLHVRNVDPVLDCPSEAERVKELAPRVALFTHAIGQENGVIAPRSAPASNHGMPLQAWPTKRPTTVATAELGFLVPLEKCWVLAKPERVELVVITWELAVNCFHSSSVRGETLCKLEVKKQNYDSE
ncbi:hypothetical protein NL676_039371 [Syzygium grande]|nr:hypothetical protein NL676_039371 [Syzygium grande]